MLCCCNIKFIEYMRSLFVYLRFIVTDRSFLKEMYDTNTLCVFSYVNYKNNIYIYYLPYSVLSSNSFLHVTFIVPHTESEFINKCKI